jgi:type I restriction-modification system DNA methylase subunit
MSYTKVDSTENLSTLLGQLPYSTPIPVCLWFLAKNKAAAVNRDFKVCSVENQNALAA